MRPGGSAGDGPAHDFPPAASSAGPQAAAPFTVSDRTVVTVTGDIDMISAPVLAGYLRRHLLASPGQLVIDLTGVLYLGAAAMAVLVDAATRGAQRGTTVTVLAPAGSAAHRVITLTGLGDFLGL
jgi:anti-anti-sigma factor